MTLNRYEFDVLAYIEENGKKDYLWRDLVDALSISGAQVNKCLESLVDKSFINKNNNELEITEIGLEALEPYRVQRAVIFAAGMGERMLPVTLKTPKPMVKVNGIRIIDRLIDALVAKDITDIVIVRGYLKECFDELLEKYPFLTFIDNELYKTENNISSALAAGDKINRCYICASDLLITNPAIIKKYQYATNYLASYALETDDWCFDYDKGFAADYRKGGTYCYNQYEITYWDEADCAKLREDWKKAYEIEGGKDLFWEFIPLVTFKENYKVEIRQCNKSDIMEIDNFYELKEIDPSYENY